jgi:hypothetical protein
MPKASPRLAVTFVEWAYPELFRGILDPNGIEAVVKRPGVRGQTGKTNFRRTVICGLARPWSVYFAGISGFATLRPG